MLALVGAKSAPRGTPLRGYSLLRSLAPPLPAEPATLGFGWNPDGRLCPVCRVDRDDVSDRGIIDPTQADEALAIALAKGHQNAAVP